MTTRSTSFCAILLAFLILTSGCATYRQRVCNDFRDAVKLNVGLGFGLYTRAKATSLLDGGMGWGGYWWELGLEDRYTDLARPCLNGCPFPLGAIPGASPEESPWTSLRLANVRARSRSDLKGDYNAVGQFFDARAIAKWDAYCIQKRSSHRIFHNDEESYTEQPFGLEVGVGAGLVDVHIGFDPVEFADLLCTMSGWDLLRDNRPLDSGRSGRKGGHSFSTPAERESRH